MKRFGVDVSHHQAPDSLPWQQFEESSSFCIVRGSYGTMKDRVTAEHVKRARSVGLAVGLYHFFRISQPVAAQINVFRQQLELAKIDVGDIVPTIDVEADPLPKMTAVSAAWQGSVLAFVDAIVDQFGFCMVYMTQREFNQLGAPAWLLTQPLWVAHYTGAAKPATPGNKPATIWQHRVGPYDPNGPGGYDKVHPLLDQNRLLGELPLIGAGAKLNVKAIPEPPTPPPTEQNDDGLEDRALAALVAAQADAEPWAQAEKDENLSDSLETFK